MTSGPNRIRRRKPTRPVGEVSRLTRRLSPEQLLEAPVASLERLARGIGVEVVHQFDEPPGEYLHRLRLAIMRKEALLACGLP